MAQAKKVALVIASEGFQPIEYEVPKKLLEQAGITVITASNKLAPAIAKDGSTTTVDYLIKEIPLNEMDGIFLIGGPGAMEHLNTTQTHQMLKKAALLNKQLGAICISARILAEAGILEEKQATGWNGDNELPGIFKQHNVYYKPIDVVRDDNFLTATGPDAAREFGEQIISMVQG